MADSGLSLRGSRVPKELWVYDSPRPTQRGEEWGPPDIRPRCRPRLLPGSMSTETFTSADDREVQDFGFTILIDSVTGGVICNVDDMLTLQQINEILFDYKDGRFFQFQLIVNNEPLKRARAFYSGTFQVTFGGPWDPLLTF